MDKISVCSINEEGRFAGPARRIIEIAKALDSHNVYTHVIYPNYNSDRYTRELKKAKVPSTALSITRLTKERKMLIKYLFCFFFEIRLLYTFFCNKKFDIIQVNGSQQFKGAIAAKFAKIPVIWVIEDAQMNPLVKKICIKLVCWIASGIIVTGKKVYDYYIAGTNLINKPIVEINPPVDTSVFNQAFVTSTQIAPKPGKKIIVTVTGINPTKGLEYFIEMAALLKVQHNDLVFYIAGANYDSQQKYFKYIKKQITTKLFPKDYIYFTGMLEDIPAFLKNADIFVCTSNLQVHMIPNGLGPQTFREGHKKEIQGVSKFVFVGRLSHEKGPDIFVKLAKQLKQYPLQFHLVGKGPMRKSLEDEVNRENLQESVFFHGWVDDVFPLLEEMDALVITSRTEGLSYAALEAFQSRIPVLALNVGGLSYTLQNGKNGLLFESIEEMFSFIENDIVQGTFDFARIIENAVKFVRNELSSKKMVTRYIEKLELE